MAAEAAIPIGRTRHRVPAVGRRRRDGGGAGTLAVAHVYGEAIELTDDPLSPPADAAYDLFVSYAHVDDAADGWVTTLVDRIGHAFAAAAGRPMAAFFDRHDIASMADWELRILGGLRRPRVFLAVVSPAYFASRYCRKEWLVFLDHEVGRSLLEGSGGFAAVYYEPVAGLDRKGAVDAAVAGWVADVRAWRGATPSRGARWAGRGWTGPTWPSGSGRRPT